MGKRLRKRQACRCKAIFCSIGLRYENDLDPTHHCARWMLYAIFSRPLRPLVAGIRNSPCANAKSNPTAAARSDSRNG